MAKLAGNILFTGTMGDITAYKRHDSDVIIARQKGGLQRKALSYAPLAGLRAMPAF